MICKTCGSMNMREEIFTAEKCSPHYGEYRCETCGRQNGYIKKPENAEKRTDKNPAWISRWRDKGTLFCATCGIKEGDIPGVRFECDHIRQLEDGGQDIFENTVMLCSNCHVEKTIKWKRTKQWRKKVSP